MADKSIKEVNQTPPPSQPNLDENRRRTRSQTRNGGLTPVAPVAEPRGRKRGQSQPGSLPKRGRKPASAAAQPEEHSNQQSENQDLSKNDEAIKEPKQMQQEKVEEKDTDVEIAENNEGDLGDTAVEVQKEEKSEEVYPKKTREEKKKQPGKKAVVEENVQDETLEEGRNSHEIEPPRQDNHTQVKEQKTDDQIAKTDKRPEDGEKPEEKNDQTGEEKIQEPQKNDKVNDELVKEEVDPKTDSKNMLVSKDLDESSKLVTKDTDAHEKVADELQANEEKDGGDNETPANETAQAIST